MMSDEYTEELPQTLLGIPGTDDIRRWRDLIDAAQGGSDTELCGLKEGPNGELLGIFRAKNNPDTESS